MPIKNTRDIIPFLNNLEKKLLDLEENLSDWDKNKNRIISMADRFNSVTQTSLTSLVRADEALAEIGTASFHSLERRGNRLKDVLSRLDKTESEDISGLVNVKKFGATGDGVTDDTVAIKNAIKYLEEKDENHILYFPSCEGYLTKETIYIPCGYSVIMDGMIIADVGQEEAGLVIGEEGKFISTKHFKLAVQRKRESNWESMDSIGIKLISLFQCEIHITTACNFTIGVQLLGSGYGFCYNNITLQLIYANKIGLHLTTKVIGEDKGFCNENVFQGGRFGIWSSLYPRGECIGVLIQSLDGGYTWNNSNLFIKPSFEMGPAGTGVVIDSGAFNYFLHARNEGNLQIAHFTGTARHNMIECSYSNSGHTDDSVSKKNLVRSIMDYIDQQMN